jgi:tight adherence protein C
MSIDVQTLDALRAAALACAALAAMLIAYVLAAVPLRAAPRLGALGAQRRRALAGSPALRAVAPLLALIAAWVAEIRRAVPGVAGRWLCRLHAHQRERLVQAGYYLGLTPDEYSALCLLGGALGALLSGALVASGIGAPWPWLLPPIGCAAFVFRVNEARGQRQKQIRRGLPDAIDLAAMCMAGGLDFPGALRVLVLHGAQDAVSEELGQLVSSLELGHTRRQALEELERRAPIAPVRAFTRALIQAEEKGSPIAEALRAQARQSRMQRSIQAEESAARAAAFLMLPLVLLMGCIFVLLMGPFFAGGFDF